MTTELPVGTWVRFKDRGKLTYAKLLQTAGGEIGWSPHHLMHVPVGVTIHNCVWKKGNALVSKSTFVYNPDAEQLKEIARGKAMFEAYQQ
jgi:hypothetical protein